MVEKLSVELWQPLLLSRELEEERFFLEVLNFDEATVEYIREDIEGDEFVLFL